MIKSYLNLLFCFVSIVLHGQPVDSIVRQSDLVFRNEAEKKTFFSSLDGTSQYLDLFLSTPENNEVTNPTSVLFMINNCVNELKEVIKGKTQEKQVKYIYTYVHRKFFTKYEHKNSFSEIFEKGFYNCVSSTALYAIIFSKLEIPFRIMEKPAHVFLIAYPETHRIFIETTSPDKGYIQFSDSYIRDYVKYLYTEHIISQRDYESKPAPDLFEKYYYSSAPVSLRTLVGIQFANFCIYQMNDRNYPVAACEMKKACYLDDYGRNRHLLKFVLIMEVNSNNYNQETFVKDLAILCRFNGINDMDVTDQFIKEEFQRLTHHQLTERSDFEKYDESFREITNAIKDTALRKEVAFIYHYELARLGFIDPKNDAYVLEHLRAAYKVNPEQAELRNIVILNLSRKVEKSNEADRIFRMLTETSGDFPFIATNAWYNSVKSNCILQLAYQNFLLGSVQKAENYLRDFETLKAADKTLEPTDAFIERAYSEAATYYYKKGNVKKCRELLKKGLFYLPDSFALQMRLNQVH